MITSCELFRFVDYIDYKRHRRCRHYIDFKIKITYLYSKDMKYLEDLHFHRTYDHRAVRRHQDFIRMMNHIGARIIYFNTTFEGNIELGDIVHKRPNCGYSMVMMKTTVYSLVERKGEFFLVSHHTHRRPEQFRVIKRFDHKPEPIDIQDYRPQCPVRSCRSHNTNVYACQRRTCHCHRKGSLLYCNNCSRISHLCHLGCGVAFFGLRGHKHTHKGTGDIVRNLYFGQKPIENAREYIFIDLKKY